MITNGLMSYSHVGKRHRPWNYTGGYGSQLQKICTHWECNSETSHRKWVGPGPLQKVYQEKIVCVHSFSPWNHVSTVLTECLLSPFRSIRFVSLMQGDIWLESEGKGKGCTATFFVRLGTPSRKPNANPRRMMPSPLQPNQGGRGPGADAHSISIMDGDTRVPRARYQSIAWVRCRNAQATLTDGKGVRDPVLWPELIAPDELSWAVGVIGWVWK
jgi:hypothetical protein